MTTRRDFLAGAAGALAASPALASQRGLGPTTARPFDYDYLLIDTRRRYDDRSGVPSLVEHLTGPGAAAVRAARGQLIGYYTPLIGWTSEQLAVMIRWPAPSVSREAALAALMRHPSVGKVEHSTLAATSRPDPIAVPKPTGIHTHRWFTIRATNSSEFIHLSERAWPDFERDFDATIFGLFWAEQSTAETRAGTVRMLLNTHYASHAVWEASRDPSPSTAALFRRRSELTLSTHVSSVRFVPMSTSAR